METEIAGAVNSCVGAVVSLPQAVQVTMACGSVFYAVTWLKAVIPPPGPNAGKVELFLRSGLDWIAANKFFAENAQTLGKATGDGK